MVPHTATVSHTRTHGRDLWTAVEARTGRLAFTFYGGDGGSRFSRRVAEDCPPHVCEDVAAFIRTGGVGPMLDYLAERGDLHPRLAEAVEQATAEFNRQAHTQGA